MNTFNRKTQKIYLVALISFILLSTACSKKLFFQTNKTVPAARGFVQIKMDANNNYTIKIKLQNLAEVERLLENKNTYVVWMQTDQISAINIGQILSKTTSFSNNLKAEFNTISAMKPIRIFITAEENGAVSFPGNLLVLSTDNF
jgi:outer membrane biogenesis lipoprotein LolB